MTTESNRGGRLQTSGLLARNPQRDALLPDPLPGSSSLPTLIKLLLFEEESGLICVSDHSFSSGSYQSEQYRAGSPPGIASEPFHR